MHITLYLHVVMDSWNFFNLTNILKFLKFQFHIFEIVSAF